MQSTPHIFLKQHIQFYYLFVSGCFVIGIGLIVFLSLMSSGEAFSESIVALVVTAALGGIQFFIAGFFILVSRSWEKRQIQRVLQNAWLVCEQVDNPQIWQQAATAYWERFCDHHKFSIWQPVITTVVVGGVTIYVMLMSSEWILMPILGGFLIMFYVIIIGHHQFMTWQYRRLYRHHQAISIPRVYIAKKGIYSEMLGYQSLHGLTSVELRTNPSPQSQNAMLLQSTLPDLSRFNELEDYVANKDCRFLELSVRKAARRITYMETMRVIVPSHQFAQIEEVITQLKSNYRIK